METLQAVLDGAGIFQYGFVNTADIRFSQDVREMCKMNTCRKYAKTWACPPAIGTVEECKKRIQGYERMLVFSVKYDLEDSFDYEGMVEGMASFKQACRKVDESLRGRIYDYLLLSNEGCDLCKECTYPNAPCRHPERVHGAIEGYGIFVNELAYKANINYINGKDTVTYFGAVAYRLGELEKLFSLND